MIVNTFHRSTVRVFGTLVVIGGLAALLAVGVRSVLAAGDTTTTAIETSGSPASYGDTVTFTATVTDVDAPLLAPTGDVDFKEGATVLGTAPLSGVLDDDQAVFMTTTLAPGPHSITADFAGDGVTLGPSSDTVAQEIDDGPSTTVLSSDNDPSVFGQDVTLTVTVSSTAGGSPSGDVAFEDTTTTSVLGDPAIDGGGHASVLVSALAIETHHITATYSGDTYFVGSSDALDQEVDKAASTTLILSDLSAHTVTGASYGVMVSVVAVAPGTGTPTGSVTVSDGTDHCTITLPASSCSLTSTTAGSKTISASYSGDSHFTVSSDSVAHTVDQASTTTSLGSAPNPSVHGQTVTLTAGVSAIAPGSGIPTGTVTFKDGARTLGSGGLDATGTASITVSDLSTGSHPTLTAVYGGDGDYAGSTSSNASQTVNAAATSTALARTGGVTPSTYGDLITFTATVTVSAPGVGTPTGNVDFKDGATVLGTMALDGTGHASFDDAGLGEGSHSVTAVYVGVTDFATSTSGTVAQQVDQAAPTVVVTTDGSPSTYGDSVTFHATVSGTTTTPTGTVIFKADGTAIGSAQTLDTGGAAQISTSSLHGGTHVITAVYSGDTDYLTATGTVADGQNVDKATLDITANDASRAYGAADPAFGVTYGPFQNGENYATSDLSGAPSCSSSASVGSPVSGNPYVITCSAGTLASDDYSFEFVDGALTIAKASTSVTVTADHHPSVFGQSVTFTATITGYGGGTSSGTVDFSIDAGGPQTQPVSGNTATLVSSSLSVNTHSVTASYNGDGNLDASAVGTLSGGQIVNKASTTTSITTDLSTATLVGGAYTVAVSVTAVAPGVGIPGGTVTVSDGTDTCPITLTAGSGSCSLSSTTRGRPKTVTATYAASGDFLASSDSASHIVDAPPVATADPYTTNENGYVASNLTTTAATGVFHNDSDADGDALTATKASDPAHGTVTLHADGSFVYTPNVAYHGTDSFSYTASDGYTSSAATAVTITVSHVNQPPTFSLIASPDVTVNEDVYDSATYSRANEAGTFSAGPGDSDSLLGYIVTNNVSSLFTQQPAISTAGTLTFRTVVNANGSATITVKAQDNGGTGNGGVDTSVELTRFTITIAPVNDAPTANGDVESVGQSSASNDFDVLANDFAGPPDEQPGGANAQTLTIIAVTQPAHGHVTIISSGTAIDYKPTAGFICPASQPTNCDTFTYTAKDSGGLTSAPGTVFVTVTPTTSRLAGADRYATGVQIVSSNYGSNLPVVYVATGTGFADGLTGAAAAARLGAPLVLINGQAATIPANIDVELKRLVGPSTQIRVLGGPSSVSTNLYTRLGAYTTKVDGQPDIVRLAGPDRYQTAVAVSANTYSTAPPASRSVFIASGLAFPDALSAAGVAGHIGAPLILVPGTRPDLSSVPTVAAELRRLTPLHIYVAGSTAAVSQGIANTLHAMFPTATIQRFAGANRYQTSTLINDFFFRNPAFTGFGPTPVSTVYVASGVNFPDALSGAALAGMKGAPLVLVPGTSSTISGVVIAGRPVIRDEFVRLLPHSIVVFGSAGAVSTAIFNQLAGLPRSQ